MLNTWSEARILECTLPVPNDWSSSLNLLAGTGDDLALFCFVSNNLAPELIQVIAVHFLSLMSRTMQVEESPSPERLRAYGSTRSNDATFITCRPKVDIPCKPDGCTLLGF